MSGADAHLRPAPRLLVHKWTDARYSFSASLDDARTSLKSAVAVLMRLGLPLAVLLAAVNTIWGFTWYLNTESWASAVYQKMTELRVDKWRAAMVQEVKAVYGAPQDALFRVEPEGIGDGDFSFYGRWRSR
jgi:hypothetical protein